MILFLILTIKRKKMSVIFIGSMVIIVRLITKTHFMYTTVLGQQN